MDEASISGLKPPFTHQYFQLTSPNQTTFISLSGTRLVLSKWIATPTDAAPTPFLWRHPPQPPWQWVTQHHLAFHDWFACDLWNDHHYDCVVYDPHHDHGYDHDGGDHHPDADQALVRVTGNGNGIGFCACHYDALQSCVAAFLQNHSLDCVNVSGSGGCDGRDDGNGSGNGIGDDRCDGVWTVTFADDQVCVNVTCCGLFAEVVTNADGLGSWNDVHLCDHLEVCQPFALVCLLCDQQWTQLWATLQVSACDEPIHNHTTRDAVTLTTSRHAALDITADTAVAHTRPSLANHTSLGRLAFECLALPTVLRSPLCPPEDGHTQPTI